MTTRHTGKVSVRTEVAHLHHGVLKLCGEAYLADSIDEANDLFAMHFVSIIERPTDLAAVPELQAVVEPRPVKPTLRRKIIEAGEPSTPSRYRRRDLRADS